MRRLTSLLSLCAAIALSACDGGDKGGGEDDTSGPSGSDTGPFDEDGDGWIARDDCDDSNSAVNPGEDEVCGNGTDEDCDGADPRCAPEGMVLLPDAPIDDGVLDVAVLTPTGITDWLGVAARVLTRRDGDGPSLERHRARRANLIYQSLLE